MREVDSEGFGAGTRRYFVNRVSKYVLILRIVLERGESGLINSCLVNFHARLCVMRACAYVRTCAALGVHATCARERMCS